MIYLNKLFLEIEKQEIIGLSYININNTNNISNTSNNINSNNTNTNINILNLNNFYFKILITALKIKNKIPWSFKKFLFVKKEISLNDKILKYFLDSNNR